MENGIRNTKTWRKTTKGRTLGKDNVVGLLKTVVDIVRKVVIHNRIHIRQVFSRNFQGHNFQGLNFHDVHPNVLPTMGRHRKEINLDFLRVVYVKDGLGDTCLFIEIQGTEVAGIFIANI